MRLKVRHYGPGPHRSGTPQSVHGKGGMGRFKEAEAKRQAEETAAKAKTGLQYRPLAEQVKATELEAEETLGRMAVRILGNDRPESVQKVSAQILSNLTHMAETEDIVIWRGLRGTLGVMADERFKTQFETDTSSGTYDRKLRAEAEWLGMGLPEDLPVEQRPVYGAFGRQAAGYGIFGFHMRDEVKDRSTMVVDDSLYAMYGNEVTAAPVRAPAINCFDGSDGILRELYAGRPPKLGDYVEVQVHGGVRLSDVKKVTFGERQVVDLSDYRAIYHKLKKAGIEVAFDSTWGTGDIEALQVSA